MTEGLPIRRALNGSTFAFCLLTGGRGAQPEDCVFEYLVLFLVREDFVAVAHVHVKHMVAGVGPDDRKVA